MPGLELMTASLPKSSYTIITNMFVLSPCTDMWGVVTNTSIMGIVQTLICSLRQDFAADKPCTMYSTSQWARVLIADITDCAASPVKCYFIAWIFCNRQQFWKIRTTCYPPLHLWLCIDDTPFLNCLQLKKIICKKVWDSLRIRGHKKSY